MSINTKTDVICEELSGLQGFCRIIIDILKTSNDDGELRYFIEPHMNNLPQVDIFKEELQELLDTLKALVYLETDRQIVEEIFMKNYLQISNLLDEIIVSEERH